MVSSASSTPPTPPNSAETSPLKEGNKNKETSTGLTDLLKKTDIKPQPSSIDAKRRLSFGRENQTPLYQTADKLRSAASNVLHLPMKRSGDAASGVYEIPSVTSADESFIFKPDIVKAERAMACYEIAKSLGMENCVLETIKARAPHVKPEFVDLEGAPITLKTVTINNKPNVVSPDACYLFTKREMDDREFIRLENPIFDEDEKQFTSVEFELKGNRLEEVCDPIERYKDETFTAVCDTDSNLYLIPKSAKLLSQEKSGYFETEDGQWAPIKQAYCVGNTVPESIHSLQFCYEIIEGKSETFTLEQGLESKLFDVSQEAVALGEIDGEDHLMVASRCHPISFNEQNSPLIERDGSRSLLKHSGGALEEYSDEEGLIPKSAIAVSFDVGYLQIKSPHITLFDGKPVVTTDQSEHTKKFFSAIDFDSFSDSVVLALVIDDEDGKSTDLEETNFLFSQKGNKLVLTAIDLDETLGTRNDYLEGTQIPHLRLGLMGYPQADMPLEGANRAHILEKLKKIQETDLVSILENPDYEHLQDPKIAEALQERVTRMTEFYNDHKDNPAPFTLRDLVYYTFPTYEKAWNEIASLDLPQSPQHPKGGKLTREMIATHVGRDSLEEIVELYKSDNR